VVLTNNSDAGQTIHAEYYYTDAPYISPVQSNLVTFVSGTSNPLVSRFNYVSGNQGTAGIPVDGSTMTIATNKIGTDTFVFDPANDSFKYLRTDIDYNSSPGDINTLLSLANAATPLLGGGTYNYVNFNVGSSDDYLYLIWDFRRPTPVELCYDAEFIENVCCTCNPCQDPNYPTCSTSRAYAFTEMVIGYYICAFGPTPSTTYTEATVYAGDTYYFCWSSWFTPRIVSGDGTIETTEECGCND